MNLREYAVILDDTELCYEARLVYLVFRRHMDIATGVTGNRRVVDYNEIRQSLEYLPARGSRDSAKRYSKDQIKRYIQLLVDRGFLLRLHGSGLRQQMVFRLPLASCDLVRPNEERHESATRGAPQDKPVVTGAAGDKSATRAPRDERHISDISDNSLSTPTAREKFSMHSEWLVINDDRVEGVLRMKGFDVDRLSMIDRGAIRDEFVLYWMDRPGQQLSQAVWEERFIESAEFYMRKRA